MIGFTGTHRTGKTTMMNLFLERNGSSRFRQLDFSISACAVDMGVISSDMSMPWEQRKKFQEYLLSALTGALLNFHNFPQPKLLYSIAEGISDRTPLDLVAYALVNQPKELTLQDSEWINSYIMSCIAVTNANYDHLYYFPPTIPFTADVKSAGEDTQLIVDDVITGLLLHPSLQVPITRIDQTHLEDRYVTILGNHNDRIRLRS